MHTPDRPDPAGTEDQDEYRQLFAHNPAPMLIYARTDQRLVAVNDAFCALYGWTPEQALQLALEDLQAPARRHEVRALAPQMHGLAGGEWQHQRRDGTAMQVLVQSHDVQRDGQACRLVVITDISRLHRTHQRDESRLRLLDSLVRGDALALQLNQLALDHEAAFPGSLCSVLLLDEAGLHLQHGAAPNLPAFYSQAVHGLAIGPAVGACGTAAYSGQRVITENIDTDPRWTEFRALAHRAGLGACWSTPVLGAGGQVLGTFAVYRRQPARPDDEELTHAAFAAGLAALAVGQQRSASRLRDSERRLADSLQTQPDPTGSIGSHGSLLDTMFSQTTDAIVLVDPKTLAFVTFNDAACRGLGYSREAFTKLHGIDLQGRLSTEDLQAQAKRAMAGEMLVVDTQILHRDGSLQDVVVTLRQVHYGERPLLSVVWRNVTESRRQVDRIHRLNQAYAVLSGVNEAIVRQRDRAALLAEVCRVAVQVGGFRRAWIGHHDAATGALRTDADHGGTVHDLLPWRNSVEAALRAAAPLVLDHPDAGTPCVAAFPIQQAEQAQQVLVLQAARPGHFDADQLALYARLVRDVGHAIESIAVEAGRRGEQRLREQLMESVAGLFVVMDAQGKLLMWNRRFEALTGFSHDAVRSSHAGDYVAKADRQLVLHSLQQVLDKQEAQVEVPLQLRDGRRVPYLLMVRRVDLEGGPVVVATGIDISDRVLAEKELSMHRRHLEQLVAQRTHELQQANLRLTREDLRLRAMLSLSQRAAGLDEPALWRHGLDALTGLVGSPCGSLHLVNPDSGQTAMVAWFHGEAAGPQAAQPAVGMAQTLAHVCADALQAGAAVATVVAVGDQPHRLLAVPVLDQDHAVLVLCVAHVLGQQPGHGGDVAPDLPQAFAPDLAHDLALAGADLWNIMQRRRTEMALVQAKAEADAASQAKSAFLANMSHEIRTPLNAVLGFAHLLQREPLSARQHAHLHKIADASQHLLQVINDILDFSKIEASKVMLDPIDFALQPCLQRLLAMVADKARANQVQLHLVLDAASPALVHGDRLRLEQILLNLLSNAVKFTPRGDVELRVAPLAPGWLRFEVTDSGIGIDEAQLLQLFEPFEQADASTTRRFGGTGLGLAICHRLAPLMGGRISVSSQLGRGSRFCLELPLAAVQASNVPALAADAGPAATRPLRGLRVLLAEDNPVNQEVAFELLSAQGAQVHVAHDGQEALQCASQGLYDLVLMDVQMPRLDGLRATIAIRQLPGWAQVPIIAMTASAFPEDRTDCLAAGMVDVLVKPVQPERLTQCLLQWTAAAAGHGTA